MDSPILPRMPTPSGRLTRWLWLGGGLVGATGLFLLWRFEPEGQFFFPRCFLHAATGLECPGCGGLRATHALLHGDIARAFAYNPWAFVGTPAVLAFAALPVMTDEARTVKVRTGISWVMLLVTLAFWIWRNTASYPFIRV